MKQSGDSCFPGSGSLNNPAPGRIEFTETVQMFVVEQMEHKFVEPPPAI